MNESQKSKEVDVLFQKLGNTWYVFSEVDGDVVYSALPDGVNPKTTKLELFEVMEDHVKKVAGYNKRKNFESNA